jgi:branched-subunit amino acid transport protein
VDKTLTIWMVTLVVGVLNFVSRVSFIAWFARNDMPPLLSRALRHVPAAMLTAIAVPAVVFIAPGTLDLTTGNAKLVAAVVAGLVAWWRKNTVETIVVGMTVLWLMRWLVG